MAPFRGGGSRSARGGSRGGSRGGFRGGSRGGFRGGPRGGSRGGSRGGRGVARDSGKLARSGIRTRSGYRRFDSQRVKDADQSSEEDLPDVADEAEEDEEDDISEDEAVDAEAQAKARAYNMLLQSFKQPEDSSERQRKRRKIEAEAPVEDTNGHVSVADDIASESLLEDEATGSEDILDEDVDAEEDVESDDEDSEAVAGSDVEDVQDSRDPFEMHFANPDDNELSSRLKSVQAGNWQVEKHVGPDRSTIISSAPMSAEGSIYRKTTIRSSDGIALKKRLVAPAQKHLSTFDSSQETLAPYVSQYNDVLYGNRSAENASSLRQIACLHALNHVLKGRDKVLKNNERLAKAKGPDHADVQDQGFTRPKVLILTETRQMCHSYASILVDLFAPEQQENKQRFDSSFTAPLEDERNMPEDFNELFAGNNDNNFTTAIKLTRKTLKFFSAFYTSDIILASPLGLRRILENEDSKKRDHDFLSSIEFVVVDQADAMQMQNWSNVETVFEHLNLQLKEAHGCDFSRVRPYYLDGNAKYLRQNMIFSAYITPEMNRLFNTSMQNVAGKLKFTPTYPDGAISTVSNIGGIKQTFSRFDSPSPASDPDARFKYFTTAILPSLLRLPKPAEGGQGILIFIPSYYDFLRIRNFFATSQQTQNISFGTIHEYSEVSDQRRARAHFVNGRHSFLLYTQRAHHFFRLRLKGVRRVVMYGLPDNPIFYEEVAGGFLDTSLQEGRVQEGEAAARVMFSKWDGLALERVVGSSRVKSMLGGTGDMFEFL
ncbi:rRNA-binding ribosome biosynthesis protein utp25 [Saxophila tyrrhenica]|uniref:U3 small nucleolar RNA-associated protein 25 n=1 Tax=Saxophila tyrrhenica TaxID=1690608 RepID=A0AAV9NVB0_9PEZI|nr:rRNA-binding ribosome biosynthesis protein utp25 [Saxophila tyrrhenica]